jgi:predicted acylesterase/phospholipase RssA
MDLKRHFAGPHFIVEPRVGEYHNFDFERAEEIIEKGYRAAEEAGYEILQFVKGK